MLVKEEKHRCENYWSGERYGEIDVILLSEEENETFIHRKLILRKGSFERLADHWQYLKWPDHSIPVDYCQLVYFISKSITNTSMPLVHCSAGVGRTSTFCTIYTMIVLDIFFIDDLALIIGTFKYQRNRLFCVETLEQYSLILTISDKIKKKFIGV